MLAFIPLSDFTLERGEANLTSYKFNKHVIDHLFCKTCGIKSFAYGAGPSGPMAAINVCHQRSPRGPKAAFQR